MSCAMVTHTSAVEYMNLPLRKFYRMFVAACRVMEKRNGGGDE